MDEVKNLSPLPVCRTQKEGVRIRQPFTDGRENPQAMVRQDSGDAMKLAVQINRRPWPPHAVIYVGKSPPPS
ncbi:hypothetical protein TIFTF001_026977 [Ficus carica]|uniref:Uncharacterized protein n=1 Tax=Ficus carica TaxID=3494 RepID=A0AA88IYX3_FICCA|nr:hypothetical protein TIFTF001_026977 [Ficus carica]